MGTCRRAPATSSGSRGALNAAKVLLRRAYELRPLTFDMTRPLQAIAFTTLLILSFSSRAAAQEWLCDTQFEDCRAPLLNLIRQETQGIDVAFWFMEEARYTAELIRKHQAGVPVRVLIDPRANSTYPLNADRLNELQAAGIPMRKRLTNYILHWKMMLFHGQNVVEFSGANSSGGRLR